MDLFMTLECCVPQNRLGNPRIQSEASSVGHQKNGAMLMQSAPQLLLCVPLKALWERKLFCLLQIIHIRLEPCKAGAEVALRCRADSSGSPLPKRHGSVWWQSQEYSLH